jgi:hypothetical protein
VNGIRSSISARFKARPIHWIISEITDTSYQWRSVASDDGGATWQLREEAEFCRVFETMGDSLPTLT